MFKQTALITWIPQSDETERAALLRQAEAAAGADFSYFGQASSASRAGDVVWHLHFADEAAWRAGGGDTALDLIEQNPVVARLDAAAYLVERSKVTRPDLKDGIYRTLFFGFLSGGPETEKQALIKALAEMQDYIPEIVNWALNPAVKCRGPSPCDYVWEQEFASQEDLTGPYMMNAYHWAFVDRWFDPEMAQKVVSEATLRHSASQLPSSIMSRYRGAAIARG